MSCKEVQCSVLPVHVCGSRLACINNMYSVTKDHRVPFQVHVYIHCILLSLLLIPPVHNFTIFASWTLPSCPYAKAANIGASIGTRTLADTVSQTVIQVWSLMRCRTNSLFQMLMTCFALARGRRRTRQTGEPLRSEVAQALLHHTRQLFFFLLERALSQPLSIRKTLRNVEARALTHLWSANASEAQEIFPSPRP